MKLKDLLRVIYPSNRMVVFDLKSDNYLTNKETERTDEYDIRHSFYKEDIEEQYPELLERVVDELFVSPKQYLKVELR